MADKIIIFSGKQYSGKDTAAKILMEAMPDFPCSISQGGRLTTLQLGVLEHE